MIRLQFAIARDLVRAALPIGATAAGIAAVAAGVSALWSAHAVLPLSRVAWVVLLAVPATAPWWLTAAAVGGAGAAMGRQVADGGWVAARSVGHGGRALLPGIGLVAALTAIGVGAGTLWIEPAARRATWRTLADASLLIRVRPGESHVVDDLVLRPSRVEGDAAHDVLLAVGDAVGSAREVRFEHDRLVALDGVLVGGDAAPWRVSFARWERPVSLDLRIDLAARSTPELREVIARTEAAGRDAAYERAVWAKRWLHPLSVALLVLAAVPLGAGARPARALVAVGVAWLLAVRAGDQLAPWIGAWCALTGVAFAAGASTWAWARWDDA